MPKISRLSVILIFTAVITGLLTIADANASNLEGAALEDHLIANSPWNGTWETPGCCSGQVEYVFERVEGKFSGKITKAPGEFGSKALGALSSLKVKGSTISFASSALTRHEFKLNEKGQLDGTGITSKGRQTYTLLSPTQK